MIKVIEEKSVPTGRIECINCHSILEYGNADLRKDYILNACNNYGLTVDKYRITCPVCGIEMYAPWINNKGN